MGAILEAAITRDLDFDQVTVISSVTLAMLFWYLALSFLICIAIVVHEMLIRVSYF